MATTLPSCCIALEQPWPCWECPRIASCLRRSTRDQLHGSASSVEPRSSPLLPGQTDMPILHSSSNILKTWISYCDIFKRNRKVASVIFKVMYMCSSYYIKQGFSKWSSGIPRRLNFLFYFFILFFLQWWKSQPTITKIVTVEFLKLFTGHLNWKGLSQTSMALIKKIIKKQLCVFKYYSWNKSLQRGVLGHKKLENLQYERSQLHV